MKSPKRTDIKADSVGPITLGPLVDQLIALRAGMGDDAVVKIVVGNSTWDIYEGARYMDGVGVIGFDND
jgi:hypothetical protein